VLYLSGVVHRDIGVTPHLGYMLTFQMGNVPPDLDRVPWAGDNCCFSAKRGYDAAAWWRWLGQMRRWQNTNLFVTAPDVVADAAATYTCSLPWLRPLRAQGWRVAYVAQDGFQDGPVPWDGFDVLFIGGSTAWKLSIWAASAASEAHVRGKPVHLARVNSRRRLQLASAFGAATADGTFLKYGPDTNLARLRAWWDDPVTVARCTDGRRSGRQRPGSSLLSSHTTV
jgi:hypothetical protein